MTVRTLIVALSAIAIVAGFVVGETFSQQPSRQAKSPTGPVAAGTPTGRQPATTPTPVASPPAPLPAPPAEPPILPVTKVTLDNKGFDKLTCEGSFEHRLQGGKYRLLFDRKSVDVVALVKGMVAPAGVSISYIPDPDEKKDAVVLVEPPPDVAFDAVLKYSYDIKTPWQANYELDASEPTEWSKLTLKVGVTNPTRFDWDSAQVVLRYEKQELQHTPSAQVWRAGVTANTDVVSIENHLVDPFVRFHAELAAELPVPKGATFANWVITAAVSPKIKPPPGDASITLPQSEGKVLLTWKHGIAKDGLVYYTENLAETRVTLRHVSTTAEYCAQRLCRGILTYRQDDKTTLQISNATGSAVQLRLLQTAEPLVDVLTTPRDKTLTLTSRKFDGDVRTLSIDLLRSVGARSCTGGSIDWLEKLIEHRAEIDKAKLELEHRSLHLTLVERDRAQQLKLGVPAIINACSTKIYNAQVDIRRQRESLAKALDRFERHLASLCWDPGRTP
jgi:hypothetical protein